MMDQQTTFRLAEDVGGLKRDVKNLANSQREQWTKIDKIEDVVNEVNLKLDRALRHEERLKNVEHGVADYRTSKNRVLGIVAGLGIAGGALAEGVTHWLTKWFGGHS